MDLKKLKILVEVARSGSFTGAAERVHLTQSAVSQQMALLEQEVRETLFDRGPRGVKLTSFALDLCTRAESLLEGMRALDESFLLQGAGSRKIRIGAFPSAGMELLPKALRTFRQANPKVQVIFRNINVEAPDNALETREVDLILSFDYGLDRRISRPNICKIDLLEDPFVAIVPAAHPLAHRNYIQLAELAEAQWIFHRHSLPYRDIYRSICNNAGFDPDIAFYTDDFHTLQGLIAEEIGVSIAPRLSLLPKRDGVALLLFEPLVLRTVSILMRRGESNASMDGFVAALREVSGALSGK